MPELDIQEAPPPISEINLLETIPTHVLFDELDRRFSGVAVAYIYDDEAGEHFSTRYSGGYSLAIGLVTRMQHDMLHDAVTQVGSDDE